MLLTHLQHTKPTEKSSLHCCEFNVVMSIQCHAHTQVSYVHASSDFWPICGIPLISQHRRMQCLQSVPGTMLPVGLTLSCSELNYHQQNIQDSCPLRMYLHYTACSSTSDLQVSGLVEQMVAWYWGSYTLIDHDIYPLPTCHITYSPLVSRVYMGGLILALHFSTCFLLLLAVSYGW